MTCFSALIFGLILLSNVDIALSQAQVSTGICYQCKDILGKAQCNASIFQCNWNSNNVCVPAPVASSASTASASASVSVTYTSCASKTTSQSCYGQDGSSTTNMCSFDNNVCHGVPNNQACNLYTTQNQCNLNIGCFFTASGSGTCANHKCGDTQNNLACAFILNSFYSATPCKWVFYSNATSKSTTQLSKQGTCVNGQATDISKAFCSSAGDLYFTYSDANNVCTSCTDTIPNGASLMNLSFLFAAAMLISLNW